MKLALRAFLWIMLALIAVCIVLALSGCSTTRGWFDPEGFMAAVVVTCCLAVLWRAVNLHHHDDDDKGH